MTDWMPSGCTLPTAAQPFRVAEFDDLFRDAVRRTERVTPTRVRLLLIASHRARAEDLAARETQCCSFFRFGFGPAGPSEFWLEIEVPPARIAVLDGLLERVPA
ncbi:hypothetical protein [Cryptosporangium sp. NPDC051539]|uniref:hypothetical protein n=1 Tax=Cryptosporangium sp. NPDC051539 TaxID=3363962 RepID=UPI00379CBBA3